MQGLRVKSKKNPRGPKTKSNAKNQTYGEACNEWQEDRGVTVGRTGQGGGKGGESSKSFKHGSPPHILELERRH